MIYLLDTNAVTDAMNEHPPLHARVAAASASSVQIDTPPEGGRTEVSMEFALLEPWSEA